MRCSPPKLSVSGWKHSGWRSCADVTIPGGPQGVPRYFRCYRCEGLVTHGQMHAGGCVCGWRKLMGCTELSWPEIVGLKLGRYRLDPWERDAIRPLFG